jgi:hypothetical protein
MENAFRHDGDVITKMIVATIPTKQVVKNFSARMVHSSVLLGIVSLHISVVTVIAIVATCQMRKIVHRDIQEEDIVQNQGFSVTIIYVSVRQTCVMVQMIAETGQMSLHLFVLILIAMRSEDSNVEITNVFLAISFATMLIIVEMVQMKIT